ncbi:lysine--tRNA ligase [Actinobacillus pleuropneumoniae]|uniref:Lysine--tRNA ligase n=1 Tax=Actinobacillus pleuropneumoniae serotype 7 (strain AP76) TaxID=537457 RepID=SYK_ACTP7|nr:lysine--tRNA ligase [Actinobacillus pleuropneumoniae]B3H1E8.1 RecName: Full=Lysine--tRNA ligase; AltName: Full=Lysyl-tRNA synthetase; Short=LysRS [Actinobacillus pleuropneumoniae serovar 7 str. AP76]ACE61520.1 lysyl-tRNA synthetase [Actinobacillus pleuropneumoniae serovar 7 str. AP76]EFN02845.1 Lysyl-tRNA synthetase [Actinobacillus pleuropneumoniae serovar 13 str. N273]UKH38984.1 lysine--tRNA ligase [Actinobacillus pleuropneumoniae]UQZ26507.1 lysine--tRNA ligase [Actinobacillus pleuropneumo
MSEVEHQELDLNGEMLARREKLAKLREQGNPFPNTFRRDAYAEKLHAQYDEVEGEALKEQDIQVKVAGRIMLKRVMGKASFFTIQDVSGQIQLYVARDNLAEGVYADKVSMWDLGDIVGAAGTLFKTKTGELTVRCSEVELLTKSLRPLPNKVQGLTDQETRYRQRYLDLISNEESRRTFMIRSKMVSGIRQFFLEKDFIEVETPMLQVIPGGAAAKPFITHHNALDVDMYLRIAPELYLKRLVVGGFERVFELNRNFRNEGVSVRHNPEFTMIEYYQAYADYHDLMDNTEELLRKLAIDILGTTTVPYGEYVFDFGKPFERITMHDAIVKYGNGITREDLDSFEKSVEIAKGLGIEIQKSWGLGSVVNAIFEEVAEHQLIQPTFLMAHPAEISPLARRNDENPEVTDRFELFIGGREIGNGFSELNDAEDQAERFDAQVAAKDAGDDEAMFKDEDFVVALEHGLPPTAGEGLGIDRLAMIFANAPSIRDVILFPAMRQK